MVESAENGNASNHVAFGDTVAMSALGCLRTQCRRDSRSKTHVWPRVVKMRDPHLQYKPQAERLIGSIRRECLNHYVILNARLKRTLSGYFRYYHNSRTHLSLGKQCPFARQALSAGKIVAIPQLGGLQHRYERIAA